MTTKLDRWLAQCQRLTGVVPPVVPTAPVRPTTPLPKGAPVGIECLDPFGRDALKRGLEARQEEIGENIDNLTGSIKALEEVFNSLPERDLIDLVAKTGKFKGELATITPAQYRKVTGKYPLPSILNKEGKVKWEYSLDILASERGFATGDELKYAIERALQTKHDIDTLKEDLKTATPEARAIKEQLSAVGEWEKQEEKRRQEELRKEWAKPPEQRKWAFIPKQVPGTPERGVQSAFTAGGKLTSQVFAPKGKGEVAQSSMEALSKKAKWEGK